MACWYGDGEPVYSEGVCFHHYMRWLTTLYGKQGAWAALKQGAPAASDAASA